MENIELFDITVSALILLLGLKGFIRGFIKEFFAIFGIVGGVFVASRISNDVATKIDSVMNFQSDNTATLVGFVVALIIFWILAYIAGLFISKVFKLSGLSIFDRFIGFIFGASKVFLLFSIITFALSNISIIDQKLNDKLHNSIIFPILKQSGSYIIKLDSMQLDNNLTQHISNTIDTTKDILLNIVINNENNMTNDNNETNITKE